MRFGYCPLAVYWTVNFFFLTMYVGLCRGSSQHWTEQEQAVLYYSKSTSNASIRNYKISQKKKKKKKKRIGRWSQ